MRFDGAERCAEDSGGGGFNLTPLIDVVFLLLVFFLVATTFQKEEVEMDLSLPESKSGTKAKDGKLLVINFTRDGRLIMNGRTVTVEGMQQKLLAAAARDKDQAVLIRGDTEARYGLFAKVFDACKQAKLRKINIRALPAGSEPK